MDQSQKVTKNAWPKHLSYLPLSMGMIHPEWIYMSHFLDDYAEEKANQKRSSPLITSPSPAAAIQIHFRSRK